MGATATDKLIHHDVFRRLCRARDYIHASFAEPLSLPHIAKRAGLSPCHFLRMFTRAFGETPKECVTRARLARAKRLLMAEHLPVTEVCLEIGFQSLGSFSALFSREFGVSPSAYRREMGRIYRIPGGYPRVVVPHCFVEQFFGLPPIPK